MPRPTVKLCLSTGQSKLRQRNTVAGRTLSWSFFPILSNQVVHCYAEDITERLNLETHCARSRKWNRSGSSPPGWRMIQQHPDDHSRPLGLAAIRSRPDRRSARVRPPDFHGGRAGGELDPATAMFSRKQVMQPHLLT